MFETLRLSPIQDERDLKEEMGEIIGRRIEEILTDEDAGRHPWTKALIDYFRSCQTRYKKSIIFNVRIK